MKKIKYIMLLLLSYTYIIPFVNSKGYDENQIVEKINMTKEYTLELVNILNDWSSKYSNNLKSILTDDLLEEISNKDKEDIIDILIKKLDTNSASELNSYKDTIIDNINIIKNNIEIIQNYLYEKSDLEIIGNINVFKSIKEAIDDTVPSINTLFNIYYDMYYSSIINNISNYNNIKDILDYYDSLCIKLKYVNNFTEYIKDKFIVILDLYDIYHLEEYNDLIHEYVDVINEKNDTSFNELHSIITNKMQILLDERIDEILNDVDLNSKESVIEANNKLNDIISKVIKIKQSLNEQISEYKKGITNDKLLNYIDRYLNKILDRLNIAIDYIKTKLLSINDIELKNIEKNIVINYDEKLIITKLVETKKDDFLNKFYSNVGSMEIINTYKDNVATLSKLQVISNNDIVNEYVIIVKGDINKTGNIDITDIVNICDKMFNKYELDKYQFISADMNDDNVIDITDAVMICDLLFKR